MFEKKKKSGVLPLLLVYCVKRKKLLKDYRYKIIPCLIRQRTSLKFFPKQIEKFNNTTVPNTCLTEITFCRAVNFILDCWNETLDLVNKL